MLLSAGLSLIKNKIVAAAVLLPAATDRISLCWICHPHRNAQYVGIGLG